MNVFAMYVHETRWKDITPFQTSLFKKNIFLVIVHLN